MGVLRFGGVMGEVTGKDENSVLDGEDWETEYDY